MASTAASRKAKGRKLQQETANRYAGKWNLTYGEDQDISSREMGQNGEDIRKHTEKAKASIPFSTECKAQENLNIWKALKQAEANAKEGEIPLLVFKRNRTKIYATLELDHLLELIE